MHHYDTARYQIKGHFKHRNYEKLSRKQACYIGTDNNRTSVPKLPCDHTNAREAPNLAAKRQCTQHKTVDKIIAIAAVSLTTCYYVTEQNDKLQPNWIPVYCLLCSIINRKGIFGHEFKGDR